MQDGLVLAVCKATVIDVPYPPRGAANTRPLALPSGARLGSACLQDGYSARWAGR